MSSVKDFLKRLGSTVGLADGDVTLVKDLFKITSCVTALAFAADDDTQRQVLFKNSTAHRMRLLTAQFVPDAAVTASDTNYSTLTLIHTTTPASGTGTAASASTKITGGLGNLTAETPYSLTNTTTEADRWLEAGEYAVVLLDGTAGTGVDLPIGMWILTYERGPND